MPVREKVWQSAVRVAAVGAACLACWGSAGCVVPGTAVEMWVSDPGLALPAVPGEAAAAQASEFRSRHAHLAGATNETLSLRLTIQGGKVPIDRPGLRATPLVSPVGVIGPPAVQIFRMHPVQVDRFPGWHIRSIAPQLRDTTPLDILVPIRAPRGGLPATFQPGETYFFWADIAIPKGAFGGEYSGRIELTSSDSPIAGIEVRLTVWPFSLPDDPDVSVIAELDHRQLFLHHVGQRGGRVAINLDDWRGTALEPHLTALLRSTMQLLQNHRLTPVVPTLSPVVKPGGGGELAVDWEHYDALVETWLSGQAFFNRVPLRHWPLPLHAVLLRADQEGAPFTPEFSRMLRQYLAHSAGHFQDKGWLERAYAVLPVTAGVTSESVRRTHEFREVADKVEPRVAIVSRLWPQDMAPYGWVDYPQGGFSEAVDIWAPPAQFYDQRVMAGERAAGRRTWVGLDRPPYSGSLAVQAPAGHARVLTWQADQLGAEVLLAGCINRWPRAEFNPTPDDCIQTDPNVLLYPGGPFGLDGPVPSVRLKHLRDSLQDAAYRALLRKHGLEHVAATLGRSLAPYAGSDAYGAHFADGRTAGWVDDLALFQLSHEIMAEELVRTSTDAGVKKPPDAAEQFERTAAWRRFMSAAKGLDLRVDGTRLRLAGKRTTWEADVECALAIVNRMRRPISGVVRFGPLPEGWTAADDGRATGAIGANSSRRVALGALARALPSTPGSYFGCPVEFVGEEGAVQRCEARASCVTAVPRHQAIRVDGSLSDWPPGTANVASDFRLIAGQAGGRGAAVAGPGHASVVFVMRDSEFLYVAINCAWQPGEADAFSGSNQVVYEDMIPVGDELVEVLIDPLNGGTRSPTDLYHIAVKPSGSYLTEKGMRFDPPCGSREPWPVEVQVATRASNERWTAELRIPLASFGQAVTEHTIWGLNITRFDAARQEFSTWSGAQGNAYDPLSLGNLYLP